MKKYLVTSYLLSMMFSGASMATQSCDNGMVAAPLSETLVTKINQACIGKAADCVSTEMAKALADERRKAALIFLEQCKESTHPAFKAALAILQPEQPIKPLPKGRTDIPWIVSISVGQQFLPSYDEGKSSGLSHSQSFFELITDHRSPRENGKVKHWGAVITLDGQPVKRSDSTTELGKVKFDDVADTLTAGIYYIHMFGTDNGTNSRPNTPNCWRAWAFCSLEGTLDNNQRYESRWGIGGKVSIRSRENLGGRDDSIDWLAEVGLHYRYSEYQAALGNGNVIPRGSLSVGLGYWDNYGDYFGKTSASYNLRILARAEYQISQSVPAYIGFRGNLGKGPDNISLYLAFRLNADDVLKLFVN